MDPQEPLTSPYESYVYAYPHKTAYRPLRPRPALRDVWRGEARDALSFYAHIPFCEVRCGFCNLFTRTGAPAGLVTSYLDALERQARTVRRALDESGDVPRFVTSAIGGGTPTYLDAEELSRLFDIVVDVMGVPLGSVPLSVEASPSTCTPDRLKVLADRGVSRLSLGVQSFDDVEARSAVRPQKRADVEAALQAVRDADIANLNVDLIYGIDGQTEASWISSLDAALAWKPEELYLYPLYVRPLTGLAKVSSGRDAEWDEQRLALYRAGRDHLLAYGYTQVSMRMFRRTDAPVDHRGDDYTCQSDGMIGLGCGARSYTSKLHYSFDYAVTAHEVRGIIDDFVQRDEADFAFAEAGFVMDEDEHRRRHLITSLLQAEGMDDGFYLDRFDGVPAALDAVGERGWLQAGERGPQLTPEGLAWSDAIGPSFFSDRVRALMADYDLR
jgi:oxygen-independent coproporphyrinogen III oxidase